MIAYNAKSMRAALETDGYRCAAVKKYADVDGKFRLVYVLYVYRNGHCVKEDGYVGRDERSALKLAVESLCKGE